VLVFAGVAPSIALDRAARADSTPGVTVFVGLWAVDGAPWNGERFTADGTVIEYDRGRAIGEFTYATSSPTVAVVDYGRIKLVYRIKNGILTTYNGRGLLRFHRVQAMAWPPAPRPPSTW
jgi:hypothetical protein